MARTYAGMQLTEEHRRDQVTIAAQVAEAIRALFRRHVDWGDIDGSVRTFAEAAAPVVAQYRLSSWMQSVDYLAAFRAVEDPGAPDDVVDAPVDPVDVARIAQELARSTRGSMKAVAKKGYTRKEGMDRGEFVAASRAEKLAVDGGRHVLEQEVRRGNGPVGYARVVDADPCPFCAMLASRGVYYEGKGSPGALLYRTDSFAAANARFVGDGEFKVHDGCCCTLEPVYMVDGEVKLPGNGNELAREWAQVAAGQPDPWGAWRRWRESGTLPENYDGPLEGKRQRARPVRGQKTGMRRAPKPMKASERDGSPRGRDSWTAQDYLDHADELEVRASRVMEEIAALRSAGQTERDVPVMQLERQHRALLSRIDRYRAQGSTM